MKTLVLIGVTGALAWFFMDTDSDGFLTNILYPFVFAFSVLSFLIWISNRVTPNFISDPDPHHTSLSGTHFLGEGMEDGGGDGV